MPASKTGATATGFAAAFGLTLSLFALWGMGQQLCGVLLPQIAGPLKLKGLELGYSQNVSSVIYMLGAIPAAFYAMRLGYKAAIQFGLGCIVLGCFALYPTVSLHAHGYFLVAMTTMALGWVFLDVAANPLAARLGPEKTFVWRLNVAQAVYPLGTIAVLVLEKWLIGTHEIAGTKFTISAAHPYVLLGAAVLVIAWLFEDRRFPPVASERASGGEGAGLRSLLTDRKILFAMAAQAVGIVILITNGAIGGKYLVAAFHANDSSPLANVFFWAAVIFAAGRFAGCALMRFISPVRLLAVFGIAGIACSLIAATGWTLISGLAVLANQFAASIMWPTILGLAIRRKGPLMKLATALVCMGGAAGANLYQLALAVWPPLNADAGMLLPALCFAVIVAFAYARSRWDAKVDAPAPRPVPQPA
ncbi:MAG TPA: hypothetical protein VMU01_01070 [Rhizomicrobium sp.]|nr:hypothetical protein [Rhizomicrobium sp.]